MLICDLAETYHIYDYRSLPPTMVVTLIAGLRDNSRLVQKACGVKASQDTLLLANIADKLTVLIQCFVGDKFKAPSMMDAINGEAEESKTPVMAFDSAEDFNAYWENINNGG